MKKSILVFVLVSFFLSGCAKEKHLTLPKGQLIVFASQQGEPAWDSVSKESKNSPFTVALLENLNKQEDINFVLRKVRQQVLDLTKQKQQPVAHESFTDGSLVLATINTKYPKKLSLHALVIGNSDYKTISKLSNPENDANAISELLTKFNFSVIKSIDRNKTQFLADISNFQKTAKDSDITIFFYAGHGVQIEGRNYLMPLDVSGNSESSIKEGGISLQEIIEKFPGNTKLFFIDADSDNPFASKSVR
jgi:uncharacterized caspase-like protein